jgi:hypothetical protein
VDEQHKRLFLQLALMAVPPPGQQHGALPPQRFDALFADWTKVCRREETPDTLVAYQM